MSNGASEVSEDSVDTPPIDLDQLKEGSLISVTGRDGNTYVLQATAQNREAELVSVQGPDAGKFQALLDIPFVMRIVRNGADTCILRLMSSYSTIDVEVLG